MTLKSRDIFQSLLASEHDEEGIRHYVDTLTLQEVESLLSLLDASSESSHLLPSTVLRILLIPYRTRFPGCFRALKLMADGSLTGKELATCQTEISIALLKHASNTRQADKNRSLLSLQQLISTILQPVEEAQNGFASPSECQFSTLQLLPAALEAYSQTCNGELSQLRKRAIGALLQVEWKPPLGLVVIHMLPELAQFFDDDSWKECRGKLMKSTNTMPASDMVSILQVVLGLGEQLQQASWLQVFRVLYGDIDEGMHGTADYIIEMSLQRSPALFECFLELFDSTKEDDCCQPQNSNRRTRADILLLLRLLQYRDPVRPESFDFLYGKKAGSKASGKRRIANLLLRAARADKNSMSMLSAMKEAVTPKTTAHKKELLAQRAVALLDAALIWCNYEKVELFYIAPLISQWNAMFILKVSLCRIQHSVETAALDVSASEITNLGQEIFAFVFAEIPDSRLTVLTTLFGEICGGASLKARAVFISLLIALIEKYPEHFNPYLSKLLEWIRSIPLTELKAVSSLLSALGPICRRYSSFCDGLILYLRKLTFDQSEGVRDVTVKVLPGLLPSTLSLDSRRQEDFCSCIVSMMSYPYRQRGTLYAEVISSMRLWKEIGDRAARSAGHTAKASNGNSGLLLLHSALAGRLQRYVQLEKQEPSSSKSRMSQEQKAVLLLDKCMDQHMADPILKEPLDQLLLACYEVEKLLPSDKLICPENQAHTLFEILFSTSIRLMRERNGLFSIIKAEEGAHGSKSVAFASSLQVLERVTAALTQVALHRSDPATFISFAALTTKSAPAPTEDWKVLAESLYVHYAAISFIRQKHFNASPLPVNTIQNSSTNILGALRISSENTKTSVTDRSLLHWSLIMDTLALLNCEDFATTVSTVSTSKPPLSIKDLGAELSSLLVNQVTQRPHDGQENCIDNDVEKEDRLEASTPDGTMSQYVDMLEKFTDQTGLTKLRRELENVASEAHASLLHALTTLILHPEAHPQMLSSILTLAGNDQSLPQRDSHFGFLDAAVNMAQIFEKELVTGIPPKIATAYLSLIDALVGKANFSFVATRSPNQLSLSLYAAQRLNAIAAIMRSVLHDYAIEQILICKSILKLAFDPRAVTFCLLEETYRPSFAYQTEMLSVALLHGGDISFKKKDSNAAPSDGPQLASYQCIMASIAAVSKYLSAALKSRKMFESITDSLKDNSCEEAITQIISSVELLIDSRVLDQSSWTSIAASMMKLFNSTIHLGAVLSQATFRLSGDGDKKAQPAYAGTLMRVIARWLHAVEALSRWTESTKEKVSGVPKKKVLAMRYQIDKALVDVARAISILDAKAQTHTQHISGIVNTLKRLQNRTVKFESMASPQAVSKLRVARQKSKKRLRSRNQYIDACLVEEDGTDSFADLEDFIVAG